MDRPPPVGVAGPAVAEEEDRRPVHAVLLRLELPDVDRDLLLQSGEGGPVAGGAPAHQRRQVHGAAQVGQVHPQHHVVGEAHDREAHLGRGHRFGEQCGMQRGQAGVELTDQRFHGRRLVGEHVSKARLIDTRRLINKVCTLERTLFDPIRKAARNLL